MPAAPKPVKRVRKAPQRIKAKGRRRFPGREDKDFLTLLRHLPCAVCLAAGEQQRDRTAVEHWVPKSRGGYDVGDTFPTCARHRTERHTLGVKSFQRLYPERNWSEEGRLYAAMFRPEVAP